MAVVTTGLYVWLVLGVSIAVVVALWVTMYYLVERFAEYHDEEIDPTESRVTE